MKVGIKVNSVCSGVPFKEACKLIPNKSIHQKNHTQRSQRTPEAGHQHIKSLFGITPSYDIQQSLFGITPSYFWFKHHLFLVAFHLSCGTPPFNPLPKKRLVFERGAPAAWGATRSTWPCSCSWSRRVHGGKTTEVALHASYGAGTGAADAWGGQSRGINMHCYSYSQCTSTNNSCFEATSPNHN